MAEEKATGALIEIGWVLAGDLDEQEIEAIRSARELLFALAFSQAFFTDRIAASWAEDVGGPIGLHHYVVLSSFVATLGLVIGGLGASFEAESYFRHVAYVDEET